MMIHSYENGKRATACISYLEASEIADDARDIILLPIPSTRDNETILNTNIYINEVLDGVEDGTVISGYGLPGAFIDAAIARGGRVLDLSLDENFLLLNAELTALCALGIFLGNGERAPADVSVGIVGYGRIGRRLTELFLYLGAKVRVFSTRRSARIDLGEYGVASEESSEDADLSGLDILFNTAPAVIFRPERIPRELRIIDLASGDNFPGVSVEKYPSVPAKMFPLSAGRAWGMAVERFIADL